MVGEEKWHSTTWSRRWSASTHTWGQKVVRFFDPDSNHIEAGTITKTYEEMTEMTIEDLNKYGANTQEGIQRCVNNEDFYLRMVNRIPGDVNFQKLYDAIEVGDLDGAFEAAHALKGVAGNLSLTPLFAPLSEMTERLRSRTEMDYSAYIAEIRRARDELAAL